MTKSTIDQIRDLDGHLLVAAERLARYRRADDFGSVRVQQGVIDRQLDRRLDLMRVRDAVHA
ncbi:MAG: hypothetical protein JWO15_3867 [Sphingomonadales bacterium]|nr:hypothetical protein [Sphingomonadales bacterium]